MAERFERAPEEVGRILRDRARALARPLEEARTPTDVLELLVFSLGGDRYGVDAGQVLEVVPLRGLTPVPCTPPFVLGVVNHRGRMLAVVDFRRLFDLGAGGVAEASRVVAVEAQGMTFGIPADALAGIVRVDAREVAAPPVALTGAKRAFVRGMTAEMVAVLDLESLARDPRILVNEEVG